MLATRGICALRKYYYSLINKTVLYKKTRWLISLMFVLLYIERVKGMSYDVITYLIFFYILQLIISYFTPKGLVEEQPDEDELLDQQLISFNQMITRNDKPLVRSMSEVQMWERITFVFLMGIICTCFKAFQIDVFWPVLMLYSAVLFCYTIHKIITKMDKYRYKFQDFTKKPIIS